jgi:hypothetical protein
MRISEAQKQGVMARGRTLVEAAAKFRLVAMAATGVYCAIHLLVAHRFSALVFAGALLFGAVAAVTAAWLSGRWFSAPST